MSRGCDPRKVEEWRSRLSRLENWDDTVAAFCRNEGISVPSLYHWKKKLQPPTCSGDFRAVHVSAPVSLSSVNRTVIDVGDGIRIQLGNDLAVVEAVVRQLLASQDNSGA